MNYLANAAIGLDMFASTLCGGVPGTTLSGRAGSAYLQGKLRGKIFCPAIDFLMWAVGAYPKPRGHCVAAIQGDVLRARVVIADQTPT